MEKTFLDTKLTNNGFQDPMGNDAHSGLERWLDRFHQPSVPSHTIITDPDFYVFLWFHNANGRLIKCPYTNDEYKTFLEKDQEEREARESGDEESVTNFQYKESFFDRMNWKFWGQPGI